MYYKLARITYRDAQASALKLAILSDTGVPSSGMSRRVFTNAHPFLGICVSTRFSESDEHGWHGFD